MEEFARSISSHQLHVKCSRWQNFPINMASSSNSHPLSRTGRRNCSAGRSTWYVSFRFFKYFFFNQSPGSLLVYTTFVLYTAGQGRLNYSTGPILHPPGRRAGPTILSFVLRFFSVPRKLARRPWPASIRVSATTRWMWPNLIGLEGGLFSLPSSQLGFHIDRTDKGRGRRHVAVFQSSSKQEETKVELLLSQNQDRSKRSAEALGFGRLKADTSRPHPSRNVCLGSASIKERKTGGKP